MGRKLFLVLTLVVAVSIAGLNLFIIVNKKTSSQIPKTSETSSTPQPKTIIPVAEASGNTFVDSPDGKLTLLMKTVKSKSEITYTFTVAGKEIFVKTADPSVSISIPYNAWSPDGKYIFLKETGTAEARFFVLSVSVSSSDQNDQTAAITELFIKKYPDLKIGDVTGWGGINLVIVNSVKNDGARGPSFWFEMPNHSLIQLSTHF